MWFHSDRCVARAWGRVSRTPEGTRAQDLPVGAGTAWSVKRSLWHTWTSVEALGAMFFLFNYIIASLAHFVSLPCCGSNSRLPSVWQRSLDVVQGPAAHCWSCLITSGAAAASCSSASYCANRVTCGFGDLRFDPDMVSREPVAIWFTNTFCMM